MKGGIRSMGGKFAIFWLEVCLLAVVPYASAQTTSDPRLVVRELVAGLSEPTAMAFMGAGDILVLQKNDGRVRRVINGVLQAGDVLDLAVDNASEQGLLGIALHPDFANNHFIYLYFTHSGMTCGPQPTPPNSPVNRICRYEWNGSALVNPTLIIDLPGTLGPNHNGGTMTFGPDGKLYFVIGDLNRNGQLQNFSTGPAPDDSGVILRLNDDGSFPTDNPFFSQGGNLRKYYAYGVRNSFGLAFDPLTGQLWDTENGPGDFDEINLVQPGFNSGWERIMGPAGRDSQGTSDLVQFTGSMYADPKFSWLDTVGPTAIVFLHSSGLGSEYENDAFVGDINFGRLYRFKPNAARDGFIFTHAGLSDLVADDAAELQELILGTGFGGITDLKMGPDGFLYVLSFTTGKIFVVSGKPAIRFGILSGLTGQTSITAGGSETSVLARGPAFQLFNPSGVLQTTQFALNLDFRADLDFVTGNFDADGTDEVLVGGRETSGLVRGPAYQLFDTNGSLLMSRFVLNSDFGGLRFSPFNVNSENGVLVCGRETTGSARGPAYQAFDSSGNLVRTQFALNKDFAVENSCLGVNLDGVAGDEVITGGREVTGLARGPALQAFNSNGSVRFTRFVLNPDFIETKFTVANISSNGILAYGRETSGANRGPAFQTFDANGNFILTRFILNPDFTNLQIFGANTTNAVIGDEIVTGGTETSGLARGAAIQVWDKNGNHLFTRFVLNPDFTEVKFDKIDIDNDGVDEIIVVGRESGGLQRGPAFQFFESNGTLLQTLFVLNNNF